MNVFERLHERYIVGRRARTLSKHLAVAIPPGPQCVLDVGCGDGRVSSLVARLRRDVDIHGIDIERTRNAWSQVEMYDGRKLPYDDGAFDVVLLVDVLHHSNDTISLLREAARVATRAVIIKDHLLEGIAAGPRLRFMDRVGNRRFGVPTPFHYWRRTQWLEAFALLGFDVQFWRESLGLYCWPLGPMFDSMLHFIARCRVGDHNA